MTWCSLVFLDVSLKKNNPDGGMSSSAIACTIWLFNIAMGNGPFVDDFPIKISIYKGFSMAMLNSQILRW